MSISNIIKSLVFCISIFLSEELLAENLLKSHKWSYVSDQVMGGKSVGRAELEITQKSALMRLTGNVSTENNGGFIQVRTDYSAVISQKISGLQITVKGNLEKYFVHIRTTGTLRHWHYYFQPFKTNSDWEVIRMPFNKFERSASILELNLNPTNLRSIGIVAFGKDHTADIYVKDLRFY